MIAQDVALGDVFRDNGSHYVRIGGQAPKGEVNVIRIHREEWMATQTQVRPICRIEEYTAGFEVLMSSTKPCTLSEIESGWVVRIEDGSGIHEAIITTRRGDVDQRSCLKLLGCGRYPADMTVDRKCRADEYRE